MPRTWEFRMNERSAWYWRSLDHESGTVVEEAPADFSTLFACVKDAERHGYALPAPCEGWYATA